MTPITTIPPRFLSLAEVQSRVCDVSAKFFSRPRHEIHLGLRLIRDLHCDSLEFLEFLLTLEDAFEFGLPSASMNDDPLFKSLFIRPDFCLGDFAEAIYAAQDGPYPHRRWRRHRQTEMPPPRLRLLPFTQLTGRLEAKWPGSRELFETVLPPRERNWAGRELPPAGPPTLVRRSSDGMLCAVIPAHEQVIIGSSAPDTPADERPAHEVKLTSFLMDVEPVSTSAYSRFLNSIGPAIDAEVLRDWFVLARDDRRRAHEMLQHSTMDAWSPRPGTERMPMMLVSWFGASAYSLWANGRDWMRYRNAEASLLPSEAQWEYAARGPTPREYPWGDDDRDDAACARHESGQSYTPESMPLAPVNQELGVSPFGLRHMAGNVWNWCRDWYDADFYHSSAARETDPVNLDDQTGVRSERGGSWVGPKRLARSSYRRGRPPAARGRCLGFRCVGEMEKV